MTADPRDPQPPARLGSDRVDRMPRHRPHRRDHLQKQHPATVRAGCPSLRIARQRLADLNRQRQDVHPAALATNHDLASTPVDIVKRDVSDLVARSPSLTSNSKIA